MREKDAASSDEKTGGFKPFFLLRYHMSHESETGFAIIVHAYVFTIPAKVLVLGPFGCCLFLVGVGT